MKAPQPLLVIVVLTLSMGIFNACSGAFSRRAEMLLNASYSEVDGSSPIESLTEAPPPPDNQNDFNYFPYDLTLDTIAYSSCESPSSRNFNFKAGAFFSQSGLRLSEYFLKNKNKLDKSSLQAEIQRSTKYKARPRLTIAHHSNLLSIARKELFSVRLWREVPTLINKKKTRIQQSSDGSFISAAILDPVQAINLAQKLNDDEWRLVLSFLNDKQETLHYTDGEIFDPGVDIYGRVYQLQFNEQPSGYRYVLSGVREDSRPDQARSPVKDWTCPHSLRLTIYRHPNNIYQAEKAYKIRTQQDPNYGKKYPSLEAAQGSDIPHTERIYADEATCEDSSTGGQVLTVVKRVLGSHWNINIPKNCISPKSPTLQCYHRIYEHPINRVSFDYQSCSYRDTLQYCPHILSICIGKIN